LKLEKAQRHTLKIIAIFFAVSLWFYVLNSEPVEIEKKIQIEYLLPKKMSISSLNEKNVTLKLKGSKAFIGNVFTNKEKLIIDLVPYYNKFGKNFKVAFHPSQITVPFGVDILELHPKETVIELDKLVREEIPIEIEYIGNMAYDKKFKEVSVEPKTLLVEGPAEVLKKISKIKAAPINLSIIDKEEGTVFLSLDEIDHRLLYDLNKKIKVKYKTQPTIPKRTKIKKE
jgi:YbbR domain-containing protein